MKKIFTLLFAVGMFAIVQAQPGNRDNRDRDNRQIDQRDNDRYDDEKDIAIYNRHYDNDDRYGNSKFGNERRMRMQIAQINREFDYKIYRVRNSFFLNRWEKQRRIHFLEDQRQQEIRMLFAKFKNKNRHNDRNDYPKRHH